MEAGQSIKTNLFQVMKVILWQHRPVPGEVKLTYNQVLPFKVCADSQLATRRLRGQAHLLEVYRPKETKIGVRIPKMLHPQNREEPGGDKTSQRLDLPSPQASQ